MCSCPPFSLCLEYATEFWKEWQLILNICFIWKLTSKPSLVFIETNWNIGSQEVSGSKKLINMLGHEELSLAGMIKMASSKAFAFNKLKANQIISTTF